jgi:hypothetical protein
LNRAAAMLPSPLKLELNSMVTKSVDGGLSSRDDNRGEVVSGLKAVREMLDEALRDLESGRVDSGLLIRSLGLGLIGMPIRLGGKAQKKVKWIDGRGKVSG